MGVGAWVSTRGSERGKGGKGQLNLCVETINPSREQI